MLNVLQEEDRYKFQLEEARASGDENAWKREAQALLELGHMALWTGRGDRGRDLLTQSERVCRSHTFQETLNSEY